MEVIFRQALLADEPKIFNALREAANWLKIKHISHWQHWTNPSQELVNDIRAAISEKEFYLVFNENHDFLAAFRQINFDFKYWSNKKDK